MTEDPMARMKQDFIADASDTVEKVSHSLSALDPEQSPSRSQVDWLFRTVHSLKGTSGMFELHEVSALAGSVEDLLEVARSATGEIDGATLEILVEAFDELAILLQRGRGEDVQSRWETVKTDLERMTQALSGPIKAVEPGEHDSSLSGLPADLKIMLSSKELATIEKRVQEGDRILKMTFDFGIDASSDHEEVVLRRLQRAGEIITILPPESGGIDDGRTVLTLVYSPGDSGADADDDFKDTVSAYGAAVTDITPDITPRKQATAVQGSAPPLTPSSGRETSSGGSHVQRASLAVKVEIGVLDTMLNTVSELYSVRLGLLGVAKRLPHTDATRRLRDDLLKLGLILNNRVGALEESIIEVRLVPVSILFERYRGEVRRLARKSGKKVELEFEGEATRIDRAMLDNLHNPLLHIIRNAVDHGIEPTTERHSQGKPEKGRIVLRARQEASHICIEVEDDGRGVDAAKVRQKSLEKGIPQAAVAPALSLIFEPGMSTCGDVTDLSGRGVGLDAAKTKIDAMNGMITVDSVVGRGARFSVYVPLTLAISRGVLVEEGDVPAIVPLGSVVEILALRADMLREIKQSGTLSHRGSRVKALALSEMLNVYDRREARSAVVLGVGETRRVLVAQKVAGETDIVSRPLPRAMVAPGFIAGATELHDGRPAIIIQPEDLLRERPVGEAGCTDVGYRLPGPSSDMALMEEKSVHLLVFSNENTTYGIGLELLKEVITLRSLIEVPVLGRTWQGIFFHRGMCHGLLRLSGTPSSKCDVRSAAIFDSPERCGVGMSHIYGNFTVPVSDIVSIPEDSGSGLLRPCGMLRWQDRDVTVLAVGTRLVEEQHDLLSATGRKR